MAVDLSVFGRLRGKAAFDREAQEFDMRKQLAQAELKKAQRLDIDSMGEMAFFKAAQGLELTPQEIAAAQVVDAKSGGLSYNPVTGEMIQKPRLSDKIGIGGLAKPQPSMDVSGFPTMSTEDLNAPVSNIPVPLPPRGSMGGLTPVNERDLFKQNVEADRKRLDEIIASAGTASKAKSTAQRMQNLQGGLGYTGIGAPALAIADKILTPLNAPDVIAGDPASRENFAKESVSDWVTQVEPLKGALTEQEGARFDKATANLSMTPQGIKLMTDLSIALGNRAAEKSQFYQDYFQQNGSLFGADAIWEQYASQNPITVLEDYAEKTRGNQNEVDPMAASRNAIMERNAQGIQNQYQTLPQPQGQPAPPKKGQVINGYMFNGGDPSKQSSWKKVQ